MKDKLGIKDIYNVEKYDLSLIRDALAVMDEMMKGTLSKDDFTREELNCLVTLVYAHDFYVCGEGNEARVSFDSSDDSDYSFAGSLVGAILSAQFCETMSPEACSDSLFKKLASYIYVRAYNRFKAEGTLMSVCVDPNSRILNVWDGETESVCSIDAFELADRVLSGFMSSEDEEADDDETEEDFEELIASGSADAEEDGEENEDDEDGGFFFALPVSEIDGLLTDMLNEHNPEVPECYEIKYDSVAS